MRPGPPCNACWCSCVEPRHRVLLGQAYGRGRPRITCSVFANLIHHLEKLEMSDGQYRAGLAPPAVMRTLDSALRIRLPGAVGRPGG